ncbi:TetR family transcriptional regulator [Grimontia sp. AD028]|uniref:Uncharacterized protein n=2 Tax=Grimontia TaxID=246861 RepID=R1H0B0_9GAMM|nr:MULTISPECIES: hypothetical protein [Grimontia]EOD81848.1 hypothetical protein D515_00006 [Grimontia indica]KKD59735.1 TetR family transcriptional regulator [Grimontia sp. AD028]NGN96962.1 hypothetical protein [Grimontia sedimenti]
MIKIGFIVGLIIIGVLVAKFLDEKSQKKFLIGAVSTVALAVVLLVISELMR